MAVSPNRPTLVDTHVHYWDPTREDWYPHLTPAADGSFLGDDTSRMRIQYDESVYLQDSDGWSVEGIVHVSGTMNGREAYLGEAKWLDDLASTFKVPTVLIGAVDPTLSVSDMAADLDTQAQSSLLRGVRVTEGIDYTSDNARELLKLLDERNLIFDLVTHPEDMTEAAAALRECPNASYVVEHTGWPWRHGIDDPDYFALWQSGMSTLSSVSDKVYCKLSGLPMSTHDIDTERMRPWIEHCLDVFGPQRCVIGSNFPVDRVFGEFDTLLSTYEQLTSSLDSKDQQSVFAGNASRIYQIPGPR